MTYEIGAPQQTCASLLLLRMCDNGLTEPSRAEGLVASQVGNFYNPLVTDTGEVTTPREYIKTEFGCVLSRRCSTAALSVCGLAH